MSRNIKRLGAVVMTVIVVATTNFAISVASTRSGVATIPDMPRPKSGVATIPDMPRPKSGVATIPDMPRPKSGVATIPDMPRP